jgi:hypothetical protein
LRDFSGIRINASDRRVERVSGLNVTLWKAGRVAVLRMDGLALGVVGPEANVLNGVAAGGLLVYAERFHGLAVSPGGIAVERALRGAAVAGLGLGTGADMAGIAIGGLVVGGGGSMAGLIAGGLGAGAGDDMRGIAVGGLGVGAGRDVWGLAVGGLGVGSGESASGILIGGLGAGAGEDVTGIAIGGIGVGAGKRVAGIAIGGVGVGAGEAIDGLAIAGIGAGAPRMRGVILAGTYVRAASVTGCAAGGWVRADESLAGLSIAVLNTTPALHGVQIGLLNHAGNNPRGFKWLPGLNLHL